MGFGNWSMANATLLLRSGETLDRRGPACQRFQTPSAGEVTACLRASDIYAKRFAVDGEWFM